MKLPRKLQASSANSRAFKFLRNKYTTRSEHSIEVILKLRPALPRAKRPERTETQLLYLGTLRVPIAWLRKLPRPLGNWRAVFELRTPTDKSRLGRANYDSWLNLESKIAPRRSGGRAEPNEDVKLKRRLYTMLYSSNWFLCEYNFISTVGHLDGHDDFIKTMKEG